MIHQPNRRKALLLAAALVCALGIGMAIPSYGTPLYQRQRSDRIIHQSTLDCQANVTPCTLYPDGGTIAVEGAILKKITNRIIFTAQERIHADAPIALSGGAQYSVRIAAQGLWEREYYRSDAFPFKAQGDGSYAATVGFSLPMRALDTYLQTIEEEIGATMGSYQISIVPIMTGQITGLGEPITLAGAQPVVFEWGSNQIELVTAGPSGTGALPIHSDQEFHIEQPLVANSLYLLGLPLPIRPIRWAAAALLIVSLAMAGIACAPYAGRLAQPASQAQRIERRYKDRIIPMRGELMPGVPTIELDAMDKLVGIADQKDLPLFKRASEGGAHYLVIDATVAYRYTPDTAAPDAAQQNWLHTNENSVGHEVS